jgi:PAS domain S-box-containing protein
MANDPERGDYAPSLGAVPVETAKILVEVFRLVKTGATTAELLRDAVTLLADYTGFDAIGLRLREGDDYPYFQTRGMSAEFVKLENSLCPRRHAALIEPGGNEDDLFLECVCGAVIEGRVDHSMPYISDYGSFWSNSNTRLLEKYPELRDSIRGNCVRAGYDSSALIPLRLGEETFGLLQFEDKREGVIPGELLSILESIAVGLAMVLSQRQHVRQLTEDRQWAEAQARDSHARFLALFENIPDGVLVVDVERKEVLFGNGAMARMLGYRLEELPGLKVMDIHSQSATPLIMAAFQNPVRGDNLFTPDVPVLRKDGTVFPADISSGYYQMAGRRCAVGLFRDITARKEVEEALRRSEKRFRTLVKLAPVPMCLVGRNGAMKLLNDRFSEVLGYTLDDVPTIGQWWSLAYPDPQYRKSAEEGWRAALEDAAEPGGYVEPAEFNVACKDGKTRVMQISAILAGDSILASLIDITEQIQVQKALRNSLEEKIALLGEVHHRVKNNLQIIASLLGLQAGRLDNPEVVEALLDTRNRVKTMGLLHETLYRSRNLARIDFGTYVRDLCGQLLISHGPVSQRIELECRIAPVGLPMEQAVPCGLIINELVTNALKHGFPDSRQGRVVVALDREGENSLVLAVRDEGAGLPVDFDPASSSSMGIQIVSGLAGQLGGRLEVEKPKGPGACLRVVFPVPQTLSFRGQ